VEGRKRGESPFYKNSLLVGHIGAGGQRGEGAAVQPSLEGRMKMKYRFPPKLSAKILGKKRGGERGGRTA